MLDAAPSSGLADDRGLVWSEGDRGGLPPAAADRAGLPRPRADHWGLLRSDGSARPAYRALLTANRYLADADLRARLAPLGEADRDGYPVARVVLDDARRGTRVQVLWRSRAGPRGVAVEASGSSAQLVDLLGAGGPVTRSADGWEVSLPPPRVPENFDPPGFQSGGYPLLLVERGVSASAPPTPRLTPR